MEIELKLDLDAADAPALRAHPLLAHYRLAPPRTRTLWNTYFDTSDLALRRAGCALRVRRTGDGLVQTLKGGGRVEHGLHMREEWETAVTRPEPDLAALRALLPAGKWRDLLEHADLAPVFTTDFERTAWQLRSANGDLVELALDLGNVVLGDLRTPIAEIELELREGDPACLAELAQRLGRDIALRPSDVSKAQRGYALFRRAGKK
jgi:triphosphatase